MNIWQRITGQSEIVGGMTLVDVASGNAVGTATNPLSINGAAVRSTTTATITNGTSVSGSVDMSSTALLGFIAPAAWTAAALNIEVSTDNTNWSSAIYDGSATAVSSWSALVAGAAYAVDAVSMLPFRYVRFRSGTASTPVNQAADRAFTVITRPLA